MKTTLFGELNDQFRRTGIGGQILVTRGIRARWPDHFEIIDRVKDFDDFNERNDPWRDHDFGKFEQGGRTIIWKIDNFDKDGHACSPDPADPRVTTVY